MDLPTALGRQILLLERVMGIEPTRPAWKAGILPLNYTRIAPTHRRYFDIIPQSAFFVKRIFEIFLIFFAVFLPLRSKSPHLADKSLTRQLFYDRIML